MAGDGIAMIEMPVFRGLISTGLPFSNWTVKFPSGEIFSIVPSSRLATPIHLLAR